MKTHAPNFNRNRLTVAIWAALYAHY